MISLATHDLLHWLATYGYWAVLVFIAIESTGIPFPGETMLLVAAIYAGTTHQLSIPLVIVAAASDAILGDNLGFLVGRVGGYRLLCRYGRFVRLDERKPKLGQYLLKRRDHILLGNRRASLSEEPKRAFFSSVRGVGRAK